MPLPTAERTLRLPETPLFRYAEPMHDSLPEIPDLTAELTARLRQIPVGRVTTYGDLATSLGDSSAARWVGEYLRNHPHPADCPCHRVIRRTGEPGLYVTGDAAEKIRLLREDGVTVVEGRVNLARHRFSTFSGKPVLQPLLDWQRTLPARTRLEPLRELPDLVAGVDLAYPARDMAVAACAVVQRSTGELVWSMCLEAPSPFPYIPGLLTFRELPPLLALLKQVQAAGRLPPVVLVDGNGILHPRRAGIAVALGVVLNHPTVGIGKSLLCGSCELPPPSSTVPVPVVVEGEPVGLALRAGPGSKPVFVSPGHRTDLASAGQLARELFHGHRIPEPVFQADRLCGAAARQL